MSQITPLMAEHWRNERLEERKAALFAFGVGLVFSLIAWACIIRAEHDSGFLFGAVLGLMIACGCIYRMGGCLWESHKYTQSIDAYEEQEEAKREVRL